MNAKDQYFNKYNMNYVQTLTMDFNAKHQHTWLKVKSSLSILNFQHANHYANSQ